MLHFSCDLCGQQLRDERYIVKLEVFPAFDPEAIDEETLEADHLQDVADALSEMEATGISSLDETDETKQFRFDLCLLCHKKFLTDPLGRNTLSRLNFSEN
ncbi:hypothetical protein MNBD_PLANCTO02-3360 [hydrothermal vent metagenome]|uniref:Uncharacterized protein n=1 Tax=hydrothermal vent metagenome TaxID=652676 RepID=A0A3B1D7P7_9ZZZZ